MATEIIFQHKEQRVAGAASVLHSAGIERSLWEFEGSPSHGAVPPTTMAAPTSATAGGLLQTDPAGGKQKWLTAVQATYSPAPGVLTLYDRLLHVSGFSGTVATEQFVDPGHGFISTTRYTNGLGVGIWIEVYTAVGATPHVLTVNYQNQAGATKATTITFGGASQAGGSAAQCWLKVPLVAGDTGVTAVKSVQLDVSTGTAGNFGLVVAYPLLQMPNNIGQPALWTGATRGFTEILTGACLMWSQMPAVNSTPATAPAVDALFTFTDK